MNIGDRDIRSQEECPHDFHPDWRNRVAMAIVETGVRPRGVRLDQFVRDQLAYLERKARDGFDTWRSAALTRAAADVKALLLANDIYEQSGKGGIRPRIEAMLLCEEHSYKDIAEMYGLAPAIIARYERLFFNVRDKFGKVLSGVGRRSKIALGDLPALDTPGNHPVYWKVLAMEGGAELLDAMWGWPSVRQLTETGYAKHLAGLLTRAMDARVRLGGMDAKAMAGLLSDMTDMLRNARKEGALGSGELSEESLALKLLMLCGMSVSRPEGARRASLDSQLQSKLAAAETSSPSSKSMTLEHVTAFVEAQRATIS